MPTKKWTEEEEEFLRTNYIELSNTELAEKFGITKNAVQKKLARMGLKRIKAVKKSPVDESAKTETVKAEEPEAVTTESHFSLANKAFYEDRDYERAIEEYKKSVKTESDETLKLRASYWMAEAYVKIGDTGKAVNIFKKIANKHKAHHLGDSSRRRIKILENYIAPE